MPVINCPRLSSHFRAMKFALICAVFLSVLLKLAQLDVRVRIVGGESANIEDYAYQVSINENGSHICGGSIINSATILTSAQCVVDKDPDTIRVRIGSSSQQSGGQVVAVRAIITHTSYSPFNFDYDVSILKLSSEISLGLGATVIEMADELPDNNELATISGWAAPSNAVSSSGLFQVAAIPLVPQSFCKSLYGEPAITARMFCAGHPMGGVDVCKGDKGGPLVYNEKLIGIVSWGIGCAQLSTPSVFSNVPILKHWITRNI